MNLKSSTVIECLSFRQLRFKISESVTDNENFFILEHYNHENLDINILAKIRYTIII